MAVWPGTVAGRRKWNHSQPPITASTPPPNDHRKTHSTPQSGSGSVSARAVTANDVLPTRRLKPMVPPARSQLTRVKMIFCSLLAGSTAGLGDAWQCRPVSVAVRDTAAGWSVRLTRVYDAVVVPSSSATVAWSEAST
jgi:hypothetical protein